VTYNPASRGADAGEPNAAAGLYGDYSNWVRLRTLILVRWIAITGQIGALLGASQQFGVSIDVPLSLLAISLSVAMNVVLLALMFDTCQLAFLLGVTGGLNNPFALLILAPATIAATALQSRATIAVGALTVVLITVISQLYLPLTLRDGTEIALPALFSLGFWLALVIGVLFLTIYARRVSHELQTMGRALMATQMALSREQKLTALGGVVAAAAHEMGTPLATIKMVSAELVHELADRPDLREDADLIRQQTDRCRDILRSMGQAGKDDLMLRAAPLTAVLREAAEPHADRGKTLHFHAASADGRSVPEPEIQRRPEAIHGLRNLVQNAVDFARGNVWVDASWTEDEIRVTVSDDGRTCWGASATRSCAAGVATTTAAGGPATKAWGLDCSLPRRCSNGLARDCISPMAATPS
jgi:two-component system sensor histidine kinase RegB